MNGTPHRCAEYWLTDNQAYPVARPLETARNRLRRMTTGARLAHTETRLSGSPQQYQGVACPLTRCEYPARALR
jgi:predicted ABC-type transport system involved in lysophospholipase L1 biosynthesis ATPase subunit